MSFSDAPSVSVDQIPDDAVLLDVREADEWELGHAPGAKHIPMSDVPARLDEIDPDHLYVICRQGGRSAAVVDYLVQVGYDARNVVGGMVAWQKLGKPLVRDDGGQAKIY